MSFISSFHSIQFEITNSDNGTYITKRIKVPRHEDETEQHFIWRLVAFSNSYQSGFEFSSYPHGELGSDLIAHNELAEVTGWVGIGAPLESTLKRAIRSGQRPKISVYLTDQEDITHFCRELRGSTENWVAEIKFYTLEDPEAIAAIAERIESSFTWSATIIDGAFFVNTLGQEWCFNVRELDIWSEYQQSILNKVQQEING